VLRRFFGSLVLSVAIADVFVGSNLNAQEKSVAPDINKAFRKPDIADFQGKFEKEGREAFEHRDEIVKACKIQEGMQIADVGAGTGLFSRLFASKVGAKGLVLAVDISEDFLNHIRETAREQNLANIQTVLCKQDSVELPEASVDLVFTCDTYHHFEFPFKTLSTIHKALKPGGRLIVVDYHRIEGTSTDWVMGHVRAGLDVVEKEITSSGFKRVSELNNVLKENYLIEYEKVSETQSPNR
jgi:ubiquinone/menaquinone biosynthesis C-methylase UbiE